MFEFNSQSNTKTAFHPLSMRESICKQVWLTDRKGNDYLPLFKRKESAYKDKLATVFNL